MKICELEPIRFKANNVVFAIYSNRYTALAIKM
jgi:hypothetical protein